MIQTEVLPVRGHRDAPSAFSSGLKSSDGGYGADASPPLTLQQLTDRRSDSGVRLDDLSFEVEDDFIFVGCCLFYFTKSDSIILGVFEICASFFSFPEVFKRKYVNFRPVYVF